MSSDNPRRRRSATESRRERRAQRWEDARDTSRPPERETNWTMKRIPVRFAQMVYALMWMAGIAWAVAGERLGGAALILASASGLIAPVGRELQGRTSVRAVAAVVLLVAAVAAIIADVLFT